MRRSDSSYIALHPRKLAPCVEAAGGLVIPDPSNEPALAEAIARLLAEPPQPDKVRASVAGRGLEPWMEAMEAALLSSQ